MYEFICLMFRDYTLVAYECPDLLMEVDLYGILCVKTQSHPIVRLGHVVVIATFGKLLFITTLDDRCINIAIVVDLVLEML